MLVGCGTDDAADTDAGLPDADAAPDAGSAQPDAAPDTAVSCAPGTRFAPGTSAFVEATDAWGLRGVRGARFSVVDIEGDGWPDVVIRQGGGPEDFSEGGERGRWLLRNTGSGFEDVTEASGLFTARDGTAGGQTGAVVASGDVDNDGDLDVYVASSNPDGEDRAVTTELRLNNGDGTFAVGPVDSAARFAGQRHVPAGVSFVDFDVDGDLDLWVTQNLDPWNGGPLQDRLFIGDGQGGFRDVTRVAGLNSRAWGDDVEALNAGLGHSWAWSAAACDLNGDHLPDLLASSYGRAPNHLWRAETDDRGDVVYANASVSSGYAYDHREDWTDNFSARCHCRDHPDDDECDRISEAPQGDCEQLRRAFGGQYRWSHAGDREPWRLGGNSGATMCADLDNDGDLDLLTSEIVHWDVGQSSDPMEVLVNTGEPDIRFERPGVEALGLERMDPGPTWDHGDITGIVLDFDNDGWPDIYVGATDYPNNYGLLFQQTAPLQFELLDSADYFHQTRSHGGVAADFDRDGDLDLLVGHSRMRCDGASGADCEDTPQVHLYLNTLGDQGHWLQLRLEGTGDTNRMAVGARVEVTAGGVTQTQEVSAGHGHFGAQRDAVLHFGLGDACRAEVRVVWPDASHSEQRFTVDGDARFHVRQGDPPEPWVLR